MRYFNSANGYYGKKAWVGRVYVKKKYFNTSNNQEYN